METLLCFVAAWTVMTVISMVWGYGYAVAFGLGFIVCALIAFWEAGARKVDAVKTDDPEGSE